MVRELRSSETRLRGIPKSNSRNAIPRGTVASRIRTLQSLAFSPHTDTQLPTTVQARRRGDLALGSTLPPITNNRSFPPRTRRPLSDNVDVATSHSFLGYKTPRTNHEEGHASCTTDLPRANPTILKSKTPSASKRAVSARDPFIYRWTTSPRVVSCPTTKQSNSNKYQMKKFQPPFQQIADTIASKSSTATTSTLRRQSVRELFLDHGVERPSGFASPTNSTEYEVGEIPGRCRVSCHVCAQINSLGRSGCVKCGHRFCFVSATTDKCASRFVPDVRQNNMLKKDSSGMARYSSCDTTTFKLKKEAFKHLGIVLHKRKSMSFANRVSDDVEYHKQKRPDQVLFDPMSKSFNANKLQAQNLVTNDCESPGCKATHRGHSPYRHAVSCTQRQQQDEGLCISTSDTPQSHFTMALGANEYPYFSEPHSRTSHNNQSIPKDIISTKSVGSMPERDRSSRGYVICHGYPRTGHEHRQSPVDSGIIGDCQHCIDDCECLACQSVPHAVRCCTSKEHKPVTHLHLVSKIRPTRSTMMSPSSEDTQLVSHELSESSRQKQEQDTQLQDSSIAENTNEPTSITTKCAKNTAPIVGTGRNNDECHKGSKRDSCTLSFAELRAIQQQVSQLQSSHPLPARQRKLATANATSSQKITSREGNAIEGADAAASACMHEYQPVLTGTFENVVGKKDQLQRCQQLTLLEREDDIAVQSNDLDIDTVYRFKYKPRKSRRDPSPLSLGSSHNDGSSTVLLSEEQVITKPPGRDVVDDVEIVRHTESRTHQSDEKDHTVAQCQDKDLLGITVIVHMANKSNMVFRVDAPMAIKAGIENNEAKQVD